MRQRANSSSSRPAEHTSRPSVQLIQITDSHLHASAEAEMRGVNVHDSLRAVLERVRASDWPADAVLATGDLVHDETRSGYERLAETLGTLGVRVYCLPGNHDIPELMREILNPPRFQYCGSAEFPCWTVVLLDTFVPKFEGGRLSESALEELDSLLSETCDKHALVCLHHQPVPIGSRWLDEMGLQNSVEFFRVIDRHSNVRGILWGHVHQAFETHRQGVRLMSTPSTCGQFLPGSDDFAIDQRPPGYRRLELRADGSIATEVVWLEDFGTNS